MITSAFIITRILAGDDFTTFVIRNEIPLMDRPALRTLWDSLTIETQENLFRAFGLVAGC